MTRPLTYSALMLCMLCLPTLILTGPAASASDLPRMMSKTGAETPSGFKVPRFVSLKYGNINGRTGPGQGHPIKWNYSRKGLPVIVVAETEMWRKIRDASGDESWMHKRTLSGQRMAITLTDVTIRAKPSQSAKGRAIASKDALLTLEKCDEAGWCAVKASSGHSGWVQRRTLWGAQSL